MNGSRIREVANAAMGRSGVLPFWFGEPDAVTAPAIREAAQQALAAGDTFYHHNLGLPQLREALANYLSRHHPRLGAERIAVTSSGVNALMVAAQALIEPGDRVVTVVPVWPNVAEIPMVLGARVDRVALELDAQRRWQLDLDRLLDTIGQDARMVVINSPNNPTGWTMPKTQIDALLEHCRRHGIWVLSDESYERLVFDGSYQAPSFLDCAGPEDPLVVAYTFSKTWQMTGWRLGWLAAPAALVPDLGKLIEYNTSCAPGFIQQAGIVAIEQGEQPIRDFIDELARRRDTLLDLLADIPGVELSRPDGAMYAFFRVTGERDSLRLAKALVTDAGLGLAPGIAFGSEGEGYLRWCFARPAEQLAEGAERLRRFLNSRT
jgi:aspartate/methionine/tyrosine aminotransferase